MGKYVCAAILQTKDDLQRGALLTIDPRKNRIALLPLRHDGWEFLIAKNCATLILRHTAAFNQPIAVFLPKSGHTIVA